MHLNDRSEATCRNMPPQHHRILLFLALKAIVTFEIYGKAQDRLIKQDELIHQ